MTTFDIHLLFIAIRDDNSFGTLLVTTQLAIPWARYILPSPPGKRGYSPKPIAAASPLPSTPRKIEFVHPSDEHDSEVTQLLDSANAGIETYEPELVGEGEGGTYFLRDAKGEIIAVFKPEDEDPQSQNNPKKNKKREGDEDDEDEDSDESEDKIRVSIPAGKTAFREVAAYRFDRGFSGVPVTVLVEIDDWRKNDGSKKTGSLQKFVPKAIASWDLGPARYSTNDIHRIGIQDLRMLNTDRHGGNLLAVPFPEKGQEGASHHLVPIDHAYCFPTSLAETNFEWLYWPQAKKPFSSELLDYIERIDENEDHKLLKSVGITEEEALRANKIATLVLKTGAKAGRTLYQIANLCYRKVPEQPSPLELACEQVESQLKQKGAAPYCEEYWALLIAKLELLLR